MFRILSFLLALLLGVIPVLAKSIGPKDYFEGLMYSVRANLRQQDNFAYSIFYTNPSARKALLEQHNAKAKLLTEAQKQKKNNLEDLAKELKEDKYSVFKAIPSWHDSPLYNVLVVPVTNQNVLGEIKYYYSNALEIGDLKIVDKNNKELECKVFNKRYVDLTNEENTRYIRTVYRWVYHGVDITKKAMVADFDLACVNKLQKPELLVIREKNLPIKNYLQQNGDDINKKILQRLSGS
ncbi:MAG: hypothetical protein KGO93_09780 [Cyanobacteria bacterium REEB446]|nr:hypothetical protein [Cyanobacteria bacterium REEB446]